MQHYSQGITLKILKFAWSMWRYIDVISFFWLISYWRASGLEYKDDFRDMLHIKLLGTNTARTLKVQFMQFNLTKTKCLNACD